jgi:hypothetical protein
VVPIGLYVDNTDLLYLQQGSQKETKQCEGTVLGEDMFDRFLDLVGVENKKSSFKNYTKKKYVLHHSNKTHKKK